MTKFSTYELECQETLRKRPDYEIGENRGTAVYEMEDAEDREFIEKLYYLSEKKVDVWLQKIEGIGILKIDFKDISETIQEEFTKEFINAKGRDPIHFLEVLSFKKVIRKPYLQSFWSYDLLKENTKRKPIEQEALLALSKEIPWAQIALVNFGKYKDILYCHVKKGIVDHYYISRRFQALKNRIRDQAVKNRLRKEKESQTFH